MLCLSDAGAASAAMLRCRSGESRSGRRNLGATAGRGAPPLYTPPPPGEAKGAMRTRFDVVVVGGGHNGLVCACYLARAGLAVCVLERYERVGGAAITEEFHPGFRNSVASYTVSLLQPKVIEELDLRRHGLEIRPRPLANFVPALDGPGLEMSSDSARMRAAIARHSRRDAERYPRFAAELGAVTDLLRPLLLEPPLDPAGGPREWLRLARRLPRFARLPARRLGALWDLLTGSAGHWLDRWFETDALKGG